MRRKRVIYEEAFWVIQLFIWRWVFHEVWPMKVHNQILSELYDYHVFWLWDLWCVWKMELRRYRYQCGCSEFTKGSILVVHLIYESSKDPSRSAVKISSWGLRKNDYKYSQIYRVKQFLPVKLYKLTENVNIMIFVLIIFN